MMSVVIATLLASPAGAQSDTQAVDSHIDEVRRTIIQKRDSALSVLLEMSDEQAAAFWPLQKGYDKDMMELGKTDQKLVREFRQAFGKLTAETASSIAERFFDLERDRLALQQKYFHQISESVSPVIAVQFIQLQRQFETELELERLKISPLAK
jgi:hypothetical protein